MIEELRKIDELTGSFKTWSYGLPMTEISYEINLRLVAFGEGEKRTDDLKSANQQFLKELCKFSDCWELWRKSFTTEVIRELRIASEDNCSSANEIVVNQYRQLSEPYFKNVLSSNAVFRTDQHWAAFGRLVAEQVHHESPDLSDDAKASEIAKILLAKINSFDRETVAGDWGRVESEIAAAIRFHTLHPVSATEPADIKTDTQKKPRKKREANAAARVCALYVKEELKQDPTAKRKQLVNDWIESKGGSWEGKKLSPSGIEKMLQANPELWKLEDT